MSASAPVTSPLAGLPIEFLGSFPDPLHPLLPAMPEFAFVGRSNVGKSSLLNAITGRRNLARVSQTPGKTQLLNVYQLPALYFIDLPGYGFARASKGEREAYRKLLVKLLGQRTSLSGVVWLLDIRHPPSKDDAEFHKILGDTGLPVLAVLTKADKLTRSKVAPTVAERAADLGLDLEQVQWVSSETGAGIRELAEAILAAAQEVA